MESSQRWDPDRYRKESRFVHEAGLPVLDALAPRPGERILDLGCGTGELTRAIADAGSEVVGLDASTPMIEQARRAYPELDFRFGRGEELGFDREFDAVFSNAALHWMPEADAVAAGIGRALVPGGRFVAEFGGYGNVAAVRGAVEAALEDLGAHGGSAAQRVASPWYFPRLGAHAALLERHGFDVLRAECFPRPSPMPDASGKSGVRAWLEIFAGFWLEPLTAEQRETVFGAVERRARAALFRDGVWWIDYVRLRVTARRSA
jgi:SAM-dependent methyltransferase